jgi:SAM-dependent methyltransferase
VSDARSLAFTADSITAGYEGYLLGPLFEPWAEDLVRRAGLGPGDAVLDVASGLGPVARQAAAAVGPGGRVVAFDISGAMLQRAGAHSPSPGGSSIARVLCSADAVACGDGSFGTVLCQQGLQFFPDRPAAVREMYRVTRRGGVVVLATWAKERDFGFFGPMLEACRESGMPEPYPGAYDPDVRTVSREEMADLLQSGRWAEVAVETVERDVTWTSSHAAAVAITGTPFGPHVAALPSDARAALEADFVARLGVGDDGRVVVRTSANVGRGRK